MNRRVLEGLVWLLGGSVITLALTLMVYFMSKQELARQTFKQLVYTVQRSSKKRNARRRKRMK